MTRTATTDEDAPWPSAAPGSSAAPGPFASAPQSPDGAGERELAAAALRAGWDLGAEALEPVPEGRVNLTFLVHEGGRPTLVLQRLGAVLGADEELAVGWAAAGDALAAAGLGRPEMLRTRAGTFLHLEPGAPGPWRLTRHLPGRPPAQGSLADAAEAAEALGRAHAAWNVPAPLRLGRHIDSGDLTNQRLCVPDDFLEAELRYQGHPNLPATLPELRRGALAAANLPTRPSFTRIFSARDLVVHLDAKRGNFLLGPPAIIDLDTVGYGDTALDLGEMCRSFAASGAPAGSGPVFDAAVLKALVAGYRRSAPEAATGLTGLLPAVVRAMAVNLARRYLVDSLAEVHFRWDRTAHRSLHLQNLSRGARCLDLAEELLDREIELTSLTLEP